LRPQQKRDFTTVLTKIVGRQATPLPCGATSRKTPPERVIASQVDL
jgi:hypothetical protein